MARFEVISGPERRRRWSEDQKRALVAAAFAPGAVVAEVARRIITSLIPILVLLSASAPAIDPAYVGIWASSPNAFRPYEGPPSG